MTGIKSAADLLAAGKASAVELTTEALARAEQTQASINAFISIDTDAALAEAQAADQQRAQGQAGVLTGIPFALKDNFCVDGGLTTCGSKMLSNFVSPYSATLVEKCKTAGLVNIGKLNMDEFAMGSSTEKSFYGPTKNPWDTTRVPGGSSGGSAAAVAARIVGGTFGTDTGGSIRQPASYCGVTGLKPSYGRVSRYGMVAFGSSLDQGGPLAQSAEDCALLLGAVAGYDPKDSTSSQAAVDDYVAALDGGVAGKTIGLPKQYFSEALSESVRAPVEAAIETLSALGAKVVSLDLPKQALALSAYYVIAPAEASSNLSRFDGVRFGHRAEGAEDLESLYRRSRDEGFGDEVKRRIVVGTYVLSEGYFDAYFRKAQQLRRLILDEFMTAFAEVDFIAGPTTPTPAFELGAKSADPVSMYLDDIYTITANLAGLPALSVPCGFAEQMPVGLQLLGKPFAEADLLAAGHAFQQHTNWHQAAPEGSV